jgi:hypothetical protein
VTTLVPAPARSSLRTRSFEERRGQARRFALDAGLIALGATSGIHVQGHTWTLLSAVCLLLVPALLLRRPTFGQLLPLWLALLALVAAVVSARINHLTLTDQRVTQWASFAVYVAGFVVLAGRNLERGFSLLVGVAVGTAIYYALPGNAYETSGIVQSWADWWKYAFSSPIVTIVLYLLTRLNAKLPLQAGVLILFAGYSLHENFRSHATVCAGAATILVVGWLAAGRIPRWTQLGIVAAFAAAMYTIVPKIAVSGIAGEAVQRKTEMQLQSGVPFILAGRTEPPLSVAAILARPWFGWGTADNISAEVFDRGKSLAIEMGFDPDPMRPIWATWYLPNGSVTLHSILLGSWAEAGVFAALLPLFLIVGALAIVWNAARYGRWATLAVTVALQAVWDVLFSPFDYNQLTTLAMLAVLFASVHLPATIPKVPKPAEAERL